LNLRNLDESKIGVTDDPYTNAAANKNLEIGVTAARTLRKKANPRWAEIAQKLYLPRKDLVLIDYSLELPLSENEKRSIIRRVVQESTGRQSGVMMEVEFYPVPAVELHDQPVLQTMSVLLSACSLRHPPATTLTS
jgi:hypothetical protein